MRRLLFKDRVRVRASNRVMLRISFIIRVTVRVRVRVRVNDRLRNIVWVTVTCKFMACLLYTSDAADESPVV